MSLTHNDFDCSFWLCFGMTEHWAVSKEVLTIREPNLLTLEPGSLPLHKDTKVYVSAVCTYVCMDAYLGMYVCMPLCMYVYGDILKVEKDMWSSKKVLRK